MEVVVISICVTWGQVRAGKKEGEAGKAGGFGHSLDPGTEGGRGPQFVPGPMPTNAC